MEAATGMGSDCEAAGHTTSTQTASWAAHVGAPGARQIRPTAAKAAVAGKAAVVQADWAAESAAGTRIPCCYSRHSLVGGTCIVNTTKRTVACGLCRTSTLRRKSSQPDRRRRPARRLDRRTPRSRCRPAVP
eukprot:scaffold89658_cov37-Tisochrysis_lutea.AAC.2